MANAILTFKIMPQSPEIDLEAVKDKAFAIAKEAGSKGDMQYQINPIAFGLKELLVLAMYTVDDSNFDAIAEKLETIEGVQSAEVYKMDLAMG
jgi:elongation factor 1-beta